MQSKLLASSNAVVELDPQDMGILAAQQAFNSQHSSAMQLGEAATNLNDDSRQSNINSKNLVSNAFATLPEKVHYEVIDNRHQSIPKHHQDNGDDNDYSIPLDNSEANF